MGYWGKPETGNEKPTVGHRAREIEEWLMLSENNRSDYLSSFHEGETTPFGKGAQR